MSALPPPATPPGVFRRGRYDTTSDATRSPTSRPMPYGSGAGRTPAPGGPADDSRARRGGAPGAPAAVARGRPGAGAPAARTSHGRRTGVRTAAGRPGGRREPDRQPPAALRPGHRSALVASVARGPGAAPISSETDRSPRIVDARRSRPVIDQKALAMRTSCWGFVNGVCRHGRKVGRIDVPGGGPARPAAGRPSAARRVKRPLWRRADARSGPLATRDCHCA